MKRLTKVHQEHFLLAEKFRIGTTKICGFNKITRYGLRGFILGRPRYVVLDRCSEPVVDVLNRPRLDTRYAKKYVGSGQV